MTSEYKIKSQEAFVATCQKAFDKAIVECDKFTNPDDPNLILPMQALFTVRNVLVQEEEKLETMKNMLV